MSWRPAMKRLELSDDQAAVLRDVLEVCVSDMGMEIADTDNMDYRERLKRKREIVASVIQRLG